MSSDEPRVGWNPSLTVVEGLALVHAAGIDGHVLVTMIDSTPDTGRLLSLTSRLAASDIAYSRVADDVSLSAANLLEFARRNEEFFCGFDEMWLFRTPPVGDKPTGVRITSETDLRMADAELTAWMKSSECLLGLGDGSGLNFVTCDERVAALLVSEK
jgi:hypothetical protein